MILLTLALIPVALVLGGIAVQSYFNKKSKGIYHIQTGKLIDPPSLLRTIRNFSVALRRNKSVRELLLARFDSGDLPLIETDYFPVRGVNIVVYHPDDIKKVLSSPDFDKMELKVKIGGHFGSVLGESLLVVGGKQGWEQRKALNPAFAYGKIKTLTQNFVELSNKFLDLVEKEGPNVNIQAWFKNFAFDTLGITMFGYDFKSMTGETIQKSNLDLTFATVIRPIDFLTFGLYYKLPLPNNKLIKDAANSSRKLLYDVINKRVEKRNKNNSDSNDLLDLILDVGSETNDKLSSDQIVHNMFLFFLAGHETSANTLTAATYFLGKHPEYQEELFNEVMSILGKDGVPTSENIGEFKFTNCVIKETLRIRPPVILIGTRVALKDTELHGYFIPKGTTVQTNLTHAHYSEQFWPNAKEFKPRRWMEEQSPEAKKIFSFAAGPRICIGHKFATVEMTIALAMMTRRFKWKVTTEWVDDPVALITSPKGGLPIILEKRVL